MYTKKLTRKSIYQDVYMFIWKRRNFQTQTGNSLVNELAIWNDLGLLVRHGKPVYFKSEHLNGKVWRVRWTCERKTLAEVVIDQKKKKAEVIQSFHILATI